jgi:23S rRNA (uracil1939-C5)-methyltransferase
LELPFVLRVERIIPGGKGLAFFQGRAVFVPQAAPGDLVLVREIRNRGSYLQALAFDILEPSPDRVRPPCPFFGDCGGCDFQQMNYSHQLHSKQEILLDALKRIGKIHLSPDRLNIFPSPPLNYRNRIQLKVAPNSVPLKWGFYAAESHRVCEIDDCLLVPKSLWEAAQWVKSLLDKIALNGSVLDEVEILEGDNHQYLGNLVLRQKQHPHDPVTGELKQQLEISPAAPGWTINLMRPSGESECVWGKGHIWKTVGEFRYRVGHGAFFQINDPMLTKLQERTLNRTSGRKALDLFCGVGFFTLPLSRRFESVEALDVNPGATLDLRANLEENRALNCDVLNLNLTEFLRTKQYSHPFKLDLLLMDPPRAGLPPRTIQGIAELKAKQLIYVSCDPSTLARDLALLVHANYEIISLDLLDLFPQTHHLESIVRLERRSEKD